MLTVLIHGADDPASLAQTLAPLVAGAVEGVLRDVVVLDAGGDEVRRVADHAGCRLDGMAEALAGAATLKGDWILLVRSGDRLPDNWIDRVLRHAGGLSGKGEAARLPDPEAGVFDRLFGRSGGAVLVSRAVLAAKAPSAAGRVDRLLRSLRPRPMRRSA